MSEQELEEGSEETLEEGPEETPEEETDSDGSDSEERVEYKPKPLSDY